MPRFSISEASDFLGVSPDTLRRWENEGKITSERTEGGHRRYDVASLLKKSGEDAGVTVLYARVSTHPQKKDLARQIAVLEAHAALQGWVDPVTIKDIGSGINYKKRGLTKLLNMLISGKVGRLVITNKDRLLRFGAELVFSICELSGVEVVILNRSPDIAPQEELVKDMLEIVTVFSAKLHSLRARENVKYLEENLGKLAGNQNKTYVE